MGKSKTNINWKKIDELGKAQCSKSEIAASIGISVTRLNTACLDENKKTIDEYIQDLRSSGHAELRMAQRKLAIKKQNPAMLIFLGKNELGQTDKPQNNTNDARKFVETIGGAQKLNINEDQLEDYEESILGDD